MQLKDYLEVNKIGRMEFAIETGIHYSTLCKYLQGQRTPTYWAAKKICEITKGQVTVAELRKKKKKPVEFLCLPTKKMRQKM